MGRRNQHTRQKNKKKKSVKRLEFNSADNMKLIIFNIEFVVKRDRLIKWEILFGYDFYVRYLLKFSLQCFSKIKKIYNKTCKLYYLMFPAYIRNF